MTQIFLDTASLTEIQEFVSWGIADGVTTNQKIFLAEGGVDFRKRVLDICNLVNGPVSVETTKSSVEELVQEAREVLLLAQERRGQGRDVWRRQRASSSK